MSPLRARGLTVGGALLLVALLRGPQGAGAETVTAVRVRGGGCFSPHANRIEVGALAPLPSLSSLPSRPLPPSGVGPGRGGG